MLQQITPEQYYEWLAFSEVEPFDETRQDVRISRLMAVLAALINKRAYSWKDFKFEFGDITADDAPTEGTPATTAKPWQQLKMIAMMHFAASKVKKS